LGGHSDRWEFLARFLLAKGISSYAIELKGFGETKHLQGHIESLRIYLDDIRGLQAIIRKEHPEAKIFILGESLGGLLSFLLSIEEPQLFNGLICISPAFKNAMQFPFWEMLQVFVAFLFNPRKRFPVPFNSQMCTRDTGYQKVMEASVKEHRLASAKLLINTFFAQLRAGFMKGELSIPTLFLIAGKDSLVDAETSRNVFQALKTQDKAIVEYPEMLHALSIELGREKVFADIVKWIEQRL
jgi:alpha-beta hydrolase superfamily lysophospholipase